jgi:hypothetical protein
VKSEDDGAVWFRIAEPHEGWCVAALQGRPLFTRVQEMGDFTHFVEPPSPRPPSVSVPRIIAAAAGGCASAPPSPVPIRPQQHE